MFAQISAKYQFVYLLEVRPLQHPTYLTLVDAFSVSRHYCFSTLNVKMEMTLILPELTFYIRAFAVYNNQGCSLSSLMYGSNCFTLSSEFVEAIVPCHEVWYMIDSMYVWRYCIFGMSKSFSTPFYESIL